jgi:hypothetical protein
VQAREATYWIFCHATIDRLIKSNGARQLWSARSCANSDTKRLLEHRLCSSCCGVKISLWRDAPAVLRAAVFYIFEMEKSPEKGHAVKVHEYFIACVWAIQRDHQKTRGKRSSKQERGRSVSVSTFAIVFPLHIKSPSMVAAAIGDNPVLVENAPVASFSNKNGRGDRPGKWKVSTSEARFPSSSPESASTRRNASTQQPVASTTDRSWPCCPVAPAQNPSAVVVATDELTFRKRRPYENNQRLDQQRLRSLKSLLSRSENNYNDNDDPTLPGLDVTGVLDGTNLAYRIVRVLVEGALHKKGTGRDWWRSRGWKARWARLCLARVAGRTAPVPLLCVAWHHDSQVCSNVILLDGTVVLALDQPQQQQPQGGDHKSHNKKVTTTRLQWHNTNRFEIRHAATKDNASLPTLSRIFTAPSRKARDAWVYAISQALLTYEKEKAAAAAGQQQPQNAELTLSLHPPASRRSPPGSPNKGAILHSLPPRRPDIPQSPRRRSTLSRPRTTAAVGPAASELHGPTGSM